jgi:hypothetical protein
MGTFAFVVGGCVIASSSLGCNAPRQQSAPTTAIVDGTLSSGDRVGMGRRASNAYFSLRALNSKVCTLAPHLAPPPGIKRLSIELELTAVGDTEVPANPFYATLVDDKAQRFESTALGCSPILGGSPLANGASTRGWVTFDVPESSVGQAVAYQPALVGVRSPRAELELR